MTSISDMNASDSFHGAARLPVPQAEIDLQPPYQAWHVGRSGEAACGMAQVINTYCQGSFRDFRIKTIQSWGAGKGWKGLRLFLSSLRQVLRVPDPARNLMVIHFSHKGSFVREGLLLWLARRRRLPVVAHIHGSQFVAFAQRWPGLTRWVLSRATKVIGLSEATVQTVRDLVPGVDAELIPNAVAEGCPNDKQPWVVFGGGVTLRKGIDVLLQAWDKAVTHDAGGDPVGMSNGSGGDWVLHIAGPIAPDVAQALAQQRWPLDSRVRLLGAVAHDDLMALLDQSQVAVLPSRDEAMPMFLLEAMARNNCVISTRVGGIPALLSDDCGLLVAPGDAEQLAAALIRALHDEPFRQRIATNGRHRFDRDCSAKAVFSRLESLWRQALAPPADGSVSH